jgi:acyl dehydratase
MVDKLYLEDTKTGDEFISYGRTITEADVVLFAALAGDWTPLHTDEEFAKRGPFGKRIAQGALGFMIQSGLLSRMYELQKLAVIAVLGFKEWEYTKPIYIGDTIRLKLKLVNVRESSKKKDRGVITFKREVINQNDEVVQQGISDFLVLKKPK